MLELRGEISRRVEVGVSPGVVAVAEDREDETEGKVARVVVAGGIAKGSMLRGL